MSAVRELCGSHRRERESTSSSSDGHQFLSDLPQDSYHEAEDRYLAELTAYSKKQFFKARDLCIFINYGCLVMMRSLLLKQLVSF